MSNTKSNSNPDNSILRIGGQPGNNSNNYTEWVEHVKKNLLCKYGIEISQVVKTNRVYAPPVPVEADYLPQVYGPDPLDPLAAPVLLAHGISAANVSILKTKCQEEFNKRKFELTKKEGPKFYSEIMGLLSEASIAVVESHADFDRAEATSDFSLLWIIIRRIHLTEYRGANPQAVAKERNEMNVKFMARKQSVTGSTDEYYKYFKQTREKLTTLGVVPPGNEDQVHHFLGNLDRQRYQTLLDDLENRVNSGHTNVYPTTLAAAYEMVSRWIPNTQQYVTKASSQSSQIFIVDKSTKVRNGRKKDTKNNLSEDTKQLKPPRHAFQGDKRTCTLCHQKGHVLKYCAYNSLGLNSPTSDDLRSNKEYMAKQTQTQEKVSSVFVASILKPDNASEYSEDSEDEEGAHSFMCDHEFSPDSTDVYLDSAASESIFKTKSFLNDFATVHHPATIRGVEKGSKGIQVIGTGNFLDLGRVSYSPNVLANLLSLSHLRDIHCNISYNGLDDEYHVIGVNGTNHIFSRRTVHKDGHLVRSMFYSLQTIQDRDLLVGVATVADNSRRYTPRELKQAEQAKEFMRRLGHVPPVEAINILKAGINNCEVSPTDITNSLAIHGHPISVIKGSTKRTKSTIVNTELPPRVVQSEQTLHLDIMFIKQLPFLVGVSTPLNLCICGSLQDRSATTVHSMIQKFLSQLQSRNFSCVQIRVDGEGALQVIADEIQREYQIEIQRAGPGEHVPIIERKIQTIKNAVRSHEHSLPFVLSRVFLIYLVLFCVSRLNLRTSSFEDKISPWEQFTGMRLDAQRDLRIGFGDYLQCTTPTTDNSMRARADGCIALLPVSNLAGSVKVYIIRTQRIVIRDQFRILPMPTELIVLLDQRALREGYTRGTEPDIDNVGLSDEETQPLAQLAHMQAIDQHILPAETLSVTFAPTDPTTAPEVSNRGAPVVVTTNTSVEVDNGGASSDTADKIIIEPSTLAETETTRTSGRPTWTPAKYSDYVLGSKLSYKAALQQRPLEALPAIQRELQQMITMEVWHPVHANSLTPAERKGIIRSSMFLKDKHTSAGLFLLFKARLVAGGDMQNKLLYSQLYSPTAACSSFFIVATLAARERRLVKTVDIVGAYLNAPLTKTGVLVHMKIAKELTTQLVKLDPTYQEYVDEKGRLVVQLDKALYGCVESAKMWYEHLTSTLIANGFTANSYDPCIMNKVGLSGYQITVLIHVDDLLITSVSNADIEHLNKYLRSAYPEIKVNQGLVIDYLGMQLDMTIPYQATISMDKYAGDLISECGVTKKASTPARDNLFAIDVDSPKANPDLTSWFHSFVARILYMAKRVYVECLGAVGFLTTRVNCCTMSDVSKLKRLLGYIIKHPKQRMVMRSNPSLPLRTLILMDAAYSVHADHKSQSAACVVLGEHGQDGATVSVICTKQKIIAKSSTQAELICASDKAGEAIHIDRLVREQGYNDMKCPILYQDNTSTMQLIENGRPMSSESRHIEQRYFWLHERQERGEVDIIHLPTKDMYINVLTKPLQGQQFVQERNALTRWIDMIDP